MLLAVAEHKGIHSEILPRIATGFCGGLSNTDGTCGAVSGGIMAISLYLGRNLPADSKDRCYQTVREFMGRFSKEFGEVNCYKLIGIHLGTAEGQALFKELGMSKRCREYVGEAALMVLGLVEENNLQG